MADNTPAEGALTGSQKLVNLANLARYNHTLCEKLGLTNDDFSYAYTKSELNKPEDLIKEGTGKNIATNVKVALDQLYDLVLAGSGIKSIAGGYAENATGTEVVFDKKSGDKATDSEKYYINFTDANGKVTNISFDAKDFVKDGVVAGSQIIYGTKGKAVTDVNDATKADGAAITTVLPKIVEGGEITNKKPTNIEEYDAYIELIVKNAVDPDATQTYSTMTIKTSDLLGDLIGDDGISFDGGNIKIDLANQTSKEHISLTIEANKTEGGHNGQLDINVAYGSKPTTFTDATEASGDDAAKSATLTIAEIGEGEGKVADGLVDNAELAAALTDVKNYVDAKDKEKSVNVIDGDNLDTAPAGETVANGIYVTSTTTKAAGTVFTVGAVVATDTEIDALFTAHA